MNSLVDEKVPYPRRIFCNRNLRLDRIEHVGFDMDYTLARYTEAMEHLQAEMVLDRMVDAYGYPREVLAARYDPGFALRGLTVDTRHGNVFKMDAHRFVGRVWHGPGPLDPELRRATYTNRKVSPADPACVMVDTLFSLPEISLYCQLVALFDGMGPDAARPTYEKLWLDLREAMDSLHRDGTLKARIQASLATYVVHDPELPEMLHRFRSAGKRTFVLTNSEPEYTDAVLRYLLDGAYPGYASYRDYFDFIVCSARKPAFFSSEEPFVAVDGNGDPVGRPADSLRRGVVYTGGNFVELARLTGMLGDDVLYVGDHIYGDILRSKIHTHWRTAMIIQEMEGELGHLDAHRPDLEELDHLERQRYQLGLELNARALDGDRAETLRAEIRRVRRQAQELEQAMAAWFNPAWGMLFRDRAELSAFGAQVEDYACVYTSRASNFRLYSPQWYFRSPRDRMAHEIEL